MAPLEPKPPDPASSLPSLPLRCSSPPKNCPQSTNFLASSSRPVSSLRAIDPRLGYSRIGSEAFPELRLVLGSTPSHEGLRHGIFGSLALVPSGSISLRQSLGFCLPFVSLQRAFRTLSGLSFTLSSADWQFLSVSLQFRHRVLRSEFQKPLNGDFTAVWVSEFQALFWVLNDRLLGWMSQVRVVEINFTQWPHRGDPGCVDGPSVAPPCHCVHLVCRWWVAPMGSGLSQEVTCLIDERRLVISGIQLSLKVILGVFVPLYLSVLVEVVMDGSLACLRFLVWYLYEENVACLVKALISSGIHQHQPLKLPWYRAVMFDLPTLFPLSAINGTVGSRIAAYVSVLTNTSISQLSSPFLLEGTRLALIFSWWSCRFLGCCYALTIGNMLVYNCGCDYVRSITPVYVWLASSKRLGCAARISITLIFGLILPAYKLRHMNHPSRVWPGVCLFYSSLVLLLHPYRVNPLCTVVCNNYLMHWCCDSYLGVIMPREHPSCYWFEALHRMQSAIIAVADEDSQRGGVVSGVVLCSSQCKQLRRFSLDPLGVTTCSVVVGVHHSIRCASQRRPDVCIGSSSAPAGLVVDVLFLIGCPVVMYYSFTVLFSLYFQRTFPILFVVDRVQRIISHLVTCISRCRILSVISCNSSFIRVLEQHYSVLGLCSIALDERPWMLCPPPLWVLFN